MPSFYVSPNQKFGVVNLKRLVLSYLGLGRQYENGQGKEYEDSLYGECPITRNRDILSAHTATALEERWVGEETNAGLIPSLEGSKACRLRKYAEFSTRTNLDKCINNPVKKVYILL